MTNASLDSTPAEEPLEGFPVGCNWKVPRADVEVAKVVVAASVVVVVVVVVVAGTVGMVVVGWTLGVVAGTEGEKVESVVGRVGVDAGEEELCPPPRQGAPNPTWQPAPQYTSPGPQKPAEEQQLPSEQDPTPGPHWA